MLNRIIIFFIIIFIFTIVLDRIILPIYVSSEEKQVPSVIGKTQLEAKKILEAQNFDIVISDTIFSNTTEIGKVIMQRPNPGKLVKSGRKVYLFVSGGIKEVMVPNLVGKSIIDSRFALERIGLKLGQVQKITSSFPEDIVFDQQFSPGTKLPQGSSVDIYISVGISEGTIEIPDLIGKSLTEAKAILESNSLQVGKINYVLSSTLLPNTVIDQYPSFGNKVNPNDKIDLFITKIGNIFETNEKIQN